MDEDRPSGVDEDPVVASFTPEARRRARRLAWLYLAAAVILLPWIVFLAVTLPKHNIDRHYRSAWVGFDIILVVAISRTAYLAFKMDPRVTFPATATAVLLFVDAWFDVTTSGSRAEVGEALLLAVLVEIPAAIFSLYVARSINRRILQRAKLEAAPADGDGHSRWRWRRERSPG